VNIGEVHPTTHSGEPTRSTLPDSFRNEGEKSGGRVNNFAPVYEKFGVHLSTPNGSGEAKAEECPWCSRTKCYVNVTTGQYHCKQCDASGNVTTFLTWVQADRFEKTTPEHYSRLGKRRGIAPQTLKRHGLAMTRRKGGG
jgi:hypothetical protein